MGTEKMGDLEAGANSSINLSFAGCGFLGIYHVGVCTCFREYAPHLVADQISGASAGALCACALICGCGLGEATTFTLNLATKARTRALGPLHPSFDLVGHLRTALRGFLPDNCHEIASGRLHISLTRVSDRKNVLVSQFDSKEDLIQALICSAHVPFYSGILPPKYKGVRYVDGGLSVNNPILNKDTITVSPFAGESDICPSDTAFSYMHVSLAGTSVQLNSGNLYRISHAFFPPPPEVLSDMCRQGFEDALQFLQKNNLINCTKHLSIQSSLSASEPVNLDQLSNDDSSDSSVSLDSVGSVSDEEDGVCHVVACEECQQQRDSALLKSLPPSVVTALQSACESVNNGLLGTVYNMRAFKVVSLMTAPWLLPVDVLLVLAKKFYVWVPYMPEDLQWFVKEFVALMKEFVDIIQSSRHHYSARFTCQLAITEHNYDKLDAGKLPASSQQLPHHYDPMHKNMGLGFAVNFHTHKKSPLKRVTEVRHHMVEDEEDDHHHQHHQHHGVQERRNSGSHDHTSHVSCDHHGHVAQSQLSRDNSSSDVPGATKEITNLLEECRHRTMSSGRNFKTLAGKAARKKLHKTSKEHMPDTSQVSYDSFDHCLQTVEKMDAILSWYYAEENDPSTIKVTEIFPVTADHPHAVPSQVDQQTSSLVTEEKWEEIVGGRGHVAPSNNTPRTNRKLQRSMSAMFNDKAGQMSSGVPLTPCASEEHLSLSAASSTENFLIETI